MFQKNHQRALNLGGRARLGMAALVSLLAVNTTLAETLIANDAKPVDQAITDKYQWLEAVEDEKALAWVKSRNEVSLKKLEAVPEFEPIHEQALEIYNTSDRIPYVTQRGDHLYNFWRDDTHVRGIWRRTSMTEYQKDNPKWETVLDLDKLAKAEDENWVYKGVVCLYPDYQRCIFSLSRGGADAVVSREFDVTSKSFIEDGFNLPESKGGVSWIDQDHVLVATNFGEDSMTDSGYPRIVKRWKRGEPVTEAKQLFAGEQADVGTFPASVTSDGKLYQLIVRADTFYTSKTYLLDGDELRHIPVPDDASIVSLINGQLIVHLKSAWEIDGKTFPQGALVKTPMKSFLNGKADVALLLAPDEKSAIESVSATQNTILVTLLENVSSKLLMFSEKDGQWRSTTIDLPEFGTLSVSSTTDTSDDFLVNYQSFLTPSTLFLVSDNGKSIKPVKSLPAFFDADKFEVEQHFAISKDGTGIPYYQIGAKNLTKDGSNPTILYGYGGFEISMKPFYSATVGSAWLERGGVYVLANIRGGGEYGPAWHQAALKKNRHKAFEDFEAIAKDLIQRKVTSPKHLGISGGSNGGLLVGSVFTRSPELFSAVVCAVPLLDMQRFNKLLAGASWMGEYGNPDDPEMWEYIKTYSPYHNLDKDTDYPKVFFQTSTRDDRVHPGHARKMVAKMQDMGHDVLYFENIEGGHGAAANNNQAAYRNALSYAYFWDQLR